MQKLFLCLLLVTSNLAWAESDLFWYDGNRKIPLWYIDYSDKYQSPIYAESNTPHSRKQILTGRIIVEFNSMPNVQQIDYLAAQHNLSLIKKINIGQFIYLFIHQDRASSLTTANEIYQSAQVQAAYPDWQYISLN